MGLGRITGFLNAVIGEPDSRKLPARFRGKEVTVGGADVRLRRNAGAAAEDHLATHELAVVLPQSSGCWLEPGIGKVSAGRPFPDVAKDLLKDAWLRCAFHGRICFDAGRRRRMKL